MNKYQKELNKFEISNSVKEKIITKIKLHPFKNLKLSYAIFAILILSITTITIAHAEKIKEVFVKWGGHTAVFDSGDEITIDYNELVKTNYDNLVLDKEFIEKIQNEMSDTYIGGNPNYDLNITRFENQTIENIEQNIGIDLVSFDKNLKYSYYLTDITEERKISRILISSDLYEISCREDCGVNYLEDKYIYITAELYTTNKTPSKVIKSESELYEEILENGVKLDRTFTKLDNINTSGYVYNYEFKKNNISKGIFQTELKFNYNNISYTLIGSNISGDEIMEYANKLK